MNSTETRDYSVEGMTCSHCVLSVREEVSEVSDAVAEVGYEVAA